MTKKKSRGDMPPINEGPTPDTKEGREKIYKLYKICVKDGFEIRTIAVMCDLEVEELEEIISEFEAD
ncbi:MAG: hypothetical protein WCO28_10665 [Bacteroidota bacterium]